jgi:hypothetical protein
MSKLANRLNDGQEKIIRNQKTTKLELDKSIIEGPQFINQWDKSTYNTKKIGKYSDINLATI